MNKEAILERLKQKYASMTKEEMTKHLAEYGIIVLQEDDIAFYDMVRWKCGYCGTIFEYHFNHYARYCPHCGKEKTCRELEDDSDEQKTNIDLFEVSDKDLFEEVNRRYWEQLDKARLQYEAKGKPVMD